MTTLPRVEDIAASRSHLQLGRDVLIFVLLLVMTFLLRFSGAPTNTLFYDEAVNATLGNEALSGDFTQNATTWTFGSYLYPITVAAANRLAGEVGIHALCALLSTLTGLFIFLMTLRLFNIGAAMWALLLFALSGASISLGTLAVYDSLGVPLMSLALYLIVLSAFENGERQYALLAGSGVAAALSVLSKYIGVLFLPALFLAALMLYLSQRRKLLPLAIFAAVAGLILLTYLALNLDALAQLWQNREKLLSVPAERLFIIQTIVAEVGPIAALAMLGMALLPASNLSVERTWRYSLVFLVLLPCLLVSTLSAPLYQVLTKNIQSLWKHTVYASVFLLPLAGFALSIVIDSLRSHRGAGFAGMRLLGAGATAFGLMWFANSGLDRHWGFQHSWPNASGAVNFLRSSPPTFKTRILAEESAVYEYYFDLGAGDRDVWSNTFYLEYRLHSDLDGMLMAIHDQYFDTVILDDYYTPEKNQSIEQGLKDAGYRLVYRDPEQTLSTGQRISIRIYRLSR
jgi:4-amino-4-deoxy-L-arabinose transferase-like glycosyltransferase